MTVTMDCTFCRICEVNFTSESHAASHYNGKKHKRKAEYSRTHPARTGPNRHSPEPPTNEEAAGHRVDHSRDGNHSQLDYDSPGPANESGHYYYCQVCSKNFSGPAPMKQHMEGSAHEKQLKRAKAKPREGDQSTECKPSSKPNLGPTTLESSPAHQDKGLRETSVRDAKLAILRATKPMLSSTWHPEIGSGQIAPEEIRGPLIKMCMEKMQSELSRLIPIIAESVVDAILDTYPACKEEQTEEAKGDTEESKGKATNQDDTLSPCLSTGESGISCSGEEAYPSPDRRDEAHPERQTNQREIQTDTSQTVSRDGKNQIKGPDQIMDGSSDEGPGHQPVISWQHSHINNDLDAPRILRNPRQNPSLNFTNIGECKENPGNTEFPGEQIESHHGIQQADHPPMDASQGQYFPGSEGFLKEVDEAKVTEFNFGMPEMEGHFNSVTSQDLIDFELNNLDNDQFHSTSLMATDEKARQDDKEGSNSSLQGTYGNESASIDVSGDIPKSTQESDSPYTDSFTADDSQLYSEEPTAVEDLLNVVKEIIQEIDSHVYVPTPPDQLGTDVQ